MEKVFIYGQIIVVMRENGKTIKCTEKEFSHGLMAESMKVITLMIRNKVMVSLHGLMVENMMDNG
jgi:hypothetical protein